MRPKLPKMCLVTVSSALLALGCGGARPTAEMPPRDVTITSATFDVGATARVCTSPAFTSVFEAIRQDLQQKAPGFTFELVSRESGCTADDVATGAVDIAITGAGASGETRRTVSDRPFAVSGIAIVANRGPLTSGLTSVSFDDLRRIFGGTIDNWNALGCGPHRIFVLHRPGGTVERSVLAKYIPPARARSIDAPALASAAYVEKIESTVGAIGYVTLTELDSSSFVRTLSLQTPRGVIAPSAANIASGAYPLKTYVHLYTRADTAATELAFEHVASDAFQDRLASMRGLVPIRAMNETMDLTPRMTR